MSSDPDELHDLLALGGGSATIAAIAADMASTMTVALGGSDPDAVDRAFKAQDKAEFRQYSYVAQGEPGRQKFEATLATARWRWAWVEDSARYLGLVDAWMATG